MYTYKHTHTHTHTHNLRARLEVALTELSLRIQACLSLILRRTNHDGIFAILGTPRLTREAPIHCNTSKVSA